MFLAALCLLKFLRLVHESFLQLFKSVPKMIHLVSFHKTNLKSLFPKLPTTQNYNTETNYTQLLILMGSLILTQFPSLLSLNLHYNKTTPREENCWVTIICRIKWLKRVECKIRVILSDETMVTAIYWKIIIKAVTISKQHTERSGNNLNSLGRDFVTWSIFGGIQFSNGVDVC